VGVMWDSSAPWKECKTGAGCMRGARICTKKNRTHWWRQHQLDAIVEE
jgi:hypothetical protein